jgi:hypothetical protein
MKNGVEMKRLYALFYMFACLLVSISAAGQSLGIGASGVSNFPDTAYANSSTSFSLYVTNTGTLPFSGTFDLRYAVNSVTQPGFIYSANTANLAPGDSLFVPASNFYFNTPQFTPGTVNIVVVWPVSASPTTDSVAVNVYVSDSTNWNSSVITGVVSLNNEPASPLVYPNPGSGELTLKNVDMQNVHLLSILDATGKSIITLSPPDNNISYLPAGCYTIVIQFNNGLKQYTRFFKASP